MIHDVHVLLSESREMLGIYQAEEYEKEKSLLCDEPQNRLLKVTLNYFTTDCSIY